jgi:hypothetical protein
MPSGPMSNKLFDLSYDVKMTDLDYPGLKHWSQTIQSQGPTIPEARARTTSALVARPTVIATESASSRETHSNSRLRTAKRPSSRNERRGHTNTQD